ncbi:hypothetical protein PCK1_001330 [Pneumocystis canis]|nr:hypothetical protein PCK1_001330 [Pneumocystis canis]
MLFYRVKWTLNNFKNITIIKRFFTNNKILEFSKEINRPPVVSSFRGGLIGFFIGMSFSSGIGYYYLVNEYQHASNTLFLSIEELQHITESMINRIKQIEEMEKNLKNLKNNVVTKNDIENLRSETKKMFESLNLAYLEVNERFSELEMDVAKLSRQARVII